MKNILFFIIPFGLFIQSCTHEDRVWVFIDPIQCMGNPWEQAWLAEHDDDMELWRELGEHGELEVIEAYYEDLGIEINKIYPHFSLQCHL